MVGVGGFSSARLGRVLGQLERLVDSGFVPGAAAVLARHGEVHVEATGTLAFDGRGVEHADGRRHDLPPGLDDASRSSPRAR